MKVEGLGDQRRSTLFQIRSIIEEHDGLSFDQFRGMVAQYKKEDPIVHQILDESIQTADSNYTRYLNNLLAGSKYGLASLTIQAAEEEGSVLGKMMSERREQIKSEKDYRKLFLGPQLGKQIQFHEIKLRQAQKQEIKQQRNELKALAKAQRKPLGIFSFGL